MSVLYVSSGGKRMISDKPDGPEQDKKRLHTQNISAYFENRSLNRYSPNEKNDGGPKRRVSRTQYQTILRERVMNILIESENHNLTL